MTNPYLDRPDVSFWKKAVAQKDWYQMLPISQTHEIVKQDMRVSAAGSCFAQKVASYIKSNKAINFVELETVSDGQPLYSAKYGNIYTTRQLLELIVEAESGKADENCTVRRDDGKYVDVYRPFVEADGFGSAEEVLEAREKHLSMVRKMFRESDVFIFTLGLTEAWVAKESGRTFPVCPDIYTDSVESKFVNFGFQSVLEDLKTCVDMINAINPDLEIIVTVSPVPLTATYTDEHVMSATTYSKSVLRAVCGEITQDYTHVNYFPSYEIVTNPFRSGHSFEENKRSVKQEVVDVVMQAFESSFLDINIHTQSNLTEVAPDSFDAEESSDSDENEPVCDDVQIEKSVGF